MPEIVSTDKAPAAVGPYSQAVRSGPFVFLSGQIPLDPSTGKMVEGTIEEQTERVLQNVREVLLAAGSAMERVVKATVYVADMADFPKVNAVYEKHLSHKPARATIQAAGLPLGARVEIDAIAEIDG